MGRCAYVCLARSRQFKSRILSNNRCERRVRSCRELMAMICCSRSRARASRTSVTLLLRAMAPGKWHSFCSLLHLPQIGFAPSHFCTKVARVNRRKNGVGMSDLVWTSASNHMRVCTDHLVQTTSKTGISLRKSLHASIARRHALVLWGKKQNSRKSAK